MSRYILIFCMITVACDNEHTTTIKGKVINLGSKEPIQGATVRLSDGLGLSGDFNVGFETSSGKSNVTLTNELGEFTISITGEYQATLSAGKDGYTYDPRESDAVTGFPGGKHRNVVVSLAAPAGFYPTFVNTSGDDCEALKVYTADFFSPKKFAKTPDKEFTGKGPYKYETYKSKFFIGDTLTYYKIEFKRNGVWHEKVDSLVIKSFEEFRNTITF